MLDLLIRIKTKILFITKVCKQFIFLTFTKVYNWFARFCSIMVTALVQLHLIFNSFYFFFFTRWLCTMCVVHRYVIHVLFCLRKQGMTHFEHLSNELLFLIFRCLHKFDSINGFTQLTQRFQEVFLSHLTHIDPTNNNVPSYQPFRLFYECVLPDNLHQFQSFTLAGCHQLGLFSNL